MKQRFLVTTIVLFVLLTAVFFLLHQQAPEYDFKALMAGNIIMAILSIVSFSLITKQLNKTPQAFVRGVFSSTFLKLFVCMIGVLTYAMVNKPNTHKASIFILLGIYAVYTVTETLMVSKIARNTK
jgi:succinate dehydrogenase hydrophobic anchor subunit